MPLIQWDKSRFTVHVAEFDEDHRELVHLLNDLHSAMKSGQGRDVIRGPRLSELLERKRLHFSAEEAWLQRQGYPGLESHRQEHQRAHARVAEFQNRIHSRDVVVSVELLEFLRAWLVDHILTVDREYSAYFAARSAR